MMFNYQVYTNDELYEMDMKSLDNLIKQYKEWIIQLDNILYTDKLNKETYGMTNKQRNKFAQDLADERYNIVNYRDHAESIYRERKLQGTRMSPKVLAFGAYTDVHTPKVKPGAKGHFSAIRGITL